MKAYKITILTDEFKENQASQVARILRTLADQMEDVGALQERIVLTSPGGNVCGDALNIRGAKTAEDLAEYILNGRTTISTSFGLKAGPGLADMIRQAY